MDDFSRHVTPAPEDLGAAPVRIHVALPGIAGIFAAVAVAILTRDLLDDARRSIGWFFAAAVVAVVAAGPVDVLSRRMPRAVAIVALLLATGVTAGGIGYGVLSDLSSQLRRFEREVPKAARELERSERFGSVARDLGLVERADSAATLLSERFWGEARARASRSGAFLAGGVLFLFLLAWLPRYVQSGLAQIEDERRRDRARSVVDATLRNGRRYLAGIMALAGAAGVAIYLVARLASLPAPAALGLIASVFAVIPYLGVIVGGVPAVLLAAAFESFDAMLLVLLATLGIQVATALAQRRLQVATVHVGPGLTLIAGLLGFAAYNLGGAVFGVAAATFGLAAIDAMARLEVEG